MGKFLQGSTLAHIHINGETARCIVNKVHVIIEVHKTITEEPWGSDFSTPKIRSTMVPLFPSSWTTLD